MRNNHLSSQRRKNAFAGFLLFISLGQVKFAHMATPKPALDHIESRQTDYQDDGRSDVEKRGENDMVKPGLDSINEVCDRSMQKSRFLRTFLTV